MQGKVIVSLVLFLFPALVAPLILLAFLTRVPGDLGHFFNDYAFAFLWGFYGLLLAGSVFLYYFFKRREARQTSADSATRDTAS